MTSPMTMPYKFGYMDLDLKQYLTTETLRALRELAGRQGRRVQAVIAEAIAEWVKVKDAQNEEQKKVQKDLNDLPGSWADDPGFEKSVVDFLYV